jgi:7-carboxy-7-deazaguanine synthase
MQITMARLNGAPEIFFSIQGEGKSIGLPSVFVRTSLCNLHCIWCDTDYTWNWTNTRFPHQNDAQPGYQKFDKKQWTAKLDVAEVATLVAEQPCRNIILTGGEPMLQQPALAALMGALRERDPAYRFETETNGTLMPIEAFDAAIDQYNVSPKLANSNNTRKLRERAAVYQFFAQSEKANFKFVLAEAADLEEVLELQTHYGIPSEKIFIMPEATSAPLLQQKRLWAVDICKEHGFRYSDRLHVQIWGGKKGV